MEHLKKSIDISIKMFAQAAAFGIVFFMLWVGIGMFQIMDAPDEVLANAYRGGAIFSILVIAIALRFLYRFWKRNGRLLSLDDILPSL